MPLVIAIFIWTPAPAGFPEVEFYRVAAEVIPLLLIALLVEQTLVNSLPWAIRLEFVCVLLIGEAAAFTGVSEVFGESPDVGGSSGWTGIIATLVGAGLVAGAMLTVAAVLVRRPLAPSPPS
jgi:hypothetical protein